MLKKTRLSRDQINTWLLHLLIFFYVLGIDLLANICLGLFFLYSLTTPGLHRKALQAISNPIFWCFVSFYILTVIGLIYSTDKGEGSKYLEMRAALILLPFPLYVASISRRNYNRLLLTFSYTCGLAAIIGLVSAFVKFQNTGDTGFFYNNFLVYPVSNQAVYFAIYVNLAVVFLVHILLTQTSMVNWKKAANVLLILFLLVFNFLLASRISIVSIYLLGFVGLILWVKKEKKYKLGMLMLGAIIAVVVLLFVTMPKTVKRFKSITNTEFSYDNLKAENHFNKELSEENWNGLTLRLAIWSCAFEVIQENPLIGVGTGDYSEKLFEKYKAKGFLYGLEMDYGSHSMYVYTLLVFGIIGFIVFMVSLLYPGMVAYRERNVLYLSFLFLFGIAFLTENVLNKYAGVVCFALFNSLLFFQPRKSD